MNTTNKENEGKTFYVATTGNDSWSGSFPSTNSDMTDGPFATLERARDAVVSAKSGSHAVAPITVMLRSGKYFLDETLELGPTSSGTREHPISYKAFPGEKPVISGGRKLDEWTNYQERILQCPVPNARGGHWKFRQLFYNGQRQIRARYPNFDTGNPLYGGWAFMEDTAAKGLHKFKFKPDTFRHKWGKPTQGEITFFPNKHGQNTIPIKEIDWEKRIITLTHEGRNYDRVPYFRYFDFQPNDRFIVENLIEELDQPGEWCLDTEDGILYFWPPDEMDIELEVVAPILDCLIDLRGASWITISGLTFTETLTGDNIHRWGLEGYGAMHNIDGLRYCGEAIHIKHSENCRIENNTFHGLGGNGIYLESYNERNMIRANKIHHVGACGVCVMGHRYEEWGESPYHAPQHPIYTQIVDNHIHHCGELNAYVAGVFVGVAQGTLVANNLIENMPHHAVCLTDGFGRTTVEYNDIVDVCRQYIDTAAINSWMEGPARYTSKDSLRSGHVIRHNRIRGVRGATVDEQGKLTITETTYLMGVYLDNYTSNCFVYGNLIITNGCGVHVNMGKNNIIENNIMVGCQQAVRLHTFHGIWPHMYGFCTGNRFSKNIYIFSGADGRLLEFFDAPGSQPPHRVIEQSDCNIVFGQQEQHHIVVIASGEPRTQSELSLVQWQALGFDVNSEVADPQFLDVEGHDFRLGSNSPALKVGFVPVDLTKIGIRE